MTAVIPPLLGEGRWFKSALGTETIWSGRIVRPSAPDSKSGGRFIPSRGFKSHSLRGDFVEITPQGLWYSGRMTTITAPRPRLQDANLTSIVGMTLGIVPLVGLIVSAVGLGIAVRQRSHPGFAIIGIVLSVFTLLLFVGTFIILFQAAAAAGLDLTQTQSPEELKAWYDRILKG